MQHVLKKAMVGGVFPSWLGHIQCASSLERNFLYDEIFVQKSYLKHGIQLKAGDCVVDVGANVGLFTLFASHAVAGSCGSKKGRVLCIEPVPDTFRCLKNNLSMYTAWCEAHGENVATFVPLCLAVGNNDEVHEKQGMFNYFPRAQGWNAMERVADMEGMKKDLKIFIDNSIQNGRTSLPGWLVWIGHVLKVHVPLLYGLVIRLATWYLLLGARKVSCQVTTLSEILRCHDIERVDLLKIDAEGSELLIVQGIEPVHWDTCIKAMVAEVHEKNLKDFVQMARENFDTVVAEQADDMRGTSLWMVFCR
ncbi:hypothetical protein M9434_003213 [Picochlorum sp. BPE23]|nr:hypothetical protein M9434_003213 [Picochlorum sp. BPE23]